MACGRRFAVLVALTTACGAKTELHVPEPVLAPSCGETFGVREVTRCDGAISEPLPMLWPGANMLAVLTSGCDIVVVVTAGGEDGAGARVSTDGGATFARLRSLPPDGLLPSLGLHQPIAIADDGTLYALARGGDS